MTERKKSITEALQLKCYQLELKDKSISAEA